MKKSFALFLLVSMVPAWTSILVGNTVLIQFLGQEAILVLFPSMLSVLGMTAYSAIQLFRGKL